MTSTLAPTVSLSGQSYTIDIQSNMSQAFYALADEIKRVEEDIEELEADGDIVDVIKAARVVNLGK